MTISSATCTVTTQGNGSATNFPFAFVIPYQADGVTPAVSVFTTNASGVRTALTLGVDYSITGVGVSAGGSITYPLTGSPLASSAWITIDRALAYVQPFAVANQAFYPHTVEQVADWITMQTQQLERDAQRTLVPPCDVASLPNAVLYAGARGAALDATSTAYGTTVVGGGTNVVPVFSNGANWLIGG